MYLLMTLNKFSHDLNLIMHYLQNEPVIDLNQLTGFYVRATLAFKWVKLYSPGKLANANNF